MRPSITNKFQIGFLAKIRLHKWYRLHYTLNLESGVNLHSSQMLINSGFGQKSWTETNRDLREPASVLQKFRTKWPQIERVVCCFYPKHNFMGNTFSSIVGIRF